MAEFFGRAAMQATFVFMGKELRTNADSHDDWERHWLREDRRAHLGDADHVEWYARARRVQRILPPEIAPTHVVAC